MNERVPFVTVGVVVGQDVESIRIPTLANQPTRGFRAEPKKPKLEDGGNTLECGRNPPRPRRVNLESTKGTPSGDDSTGVPEGVVEGTQSGTVGGIGQFGDQHSGATVCKGESETDEETSANEHADALGGGLEGSTNNLLKFMGSH